MKYIELVKTFNTTFNKLNSESPTVDIPQFEKEFIYNFLLEELEEYKQGVENNDIVEIADAFGDIMYVLCAGILAYGLQDKFNDIFQEIQDSNMSKCCNSEEEAIQTVEVRSSEQLEPCHYEQVGDKYVVYRTRDRKVMKSINYFKPDIKKYLNS